MTTVKKLLSLRTLALLLAGALLTAFFVIAFSIVYRNVPRVLLPAEDSFLNRQMDVMRGVFSEAVDDIFRSAGIIAFQRDTLDLAEGRGDETIFASSRLDISELPSREIAFAIIKNSVGEDVFRQISTPASGRELPDALFAYLNGVAEDTMKQGRQPRPLETPLRNLGKGGVLLFDDIPVLLAVMPIMKTRIDTAPTGTVILGSILDNGYFKRLVHDTDIEFTLGKATAASPEETAITRENELTVTSVLSMTGMDGQALQLTMTASRTMYAQGKLVMENAALLLVVSAFVFMVAVYVLLSWFLVRPMERLSRDIKGENIHNGLHAARYSPTREFDELCAAINSMLQRLDQSRISLSALQRILDEMDAFVYVSDLESNELLFSNTKLVEHFGIEGDCAGKKCWEVLHPGMTERCAFCPIPFLEKDKSPDPQPIVWEDNHPITGRFYRNTDCLIEWSGGKKAHLQHRIDITEIRNTEEALTRRLEQQELMLSMSQSFIAKGDMPALINRALSMVGEFMGISKILVARLNEEAGTLDADYEWYNEGHPVERPTEKTSLPFHKGTLEYDSFYIDDIPYLAYDDITNMPVFAYAAGHGIKSLVGLPIHVEGKFWGMLSFNECLRTRHWTESDIQLAHMVHNVISGAVTRDIMEEELVRMSSIVRSASQCMAYLSVDGQFEYFNPALPATVGYTAAELDEGGIQLVLSPAVHAHIIRRIIPRVLREGKGEFEVPLIRKDGEVLIMSLSAFQTDVRGGRNGLGIGAIAQDITEKRRLERELVKAKDLAEQSSQAKGEFLSRMSHEMRTPLNAVIGMTSIGMAARDIEKKEYCLAKIDDASKHLLGVINDILDMSKIEAKKFELSFTEFDIERMLMRVCNVVNFKVEEKSQNLVISIDRDLPYTIISDEQRLAQVIANLLSNAVKFTPEAGTVTLSVEKAQEEDGICTILVSVKDTGIGISKENQARLFRSFEQADGGIARKFGGTGLGLAISKSIVQMLGGEISVESEEGAGSTFAFTFKTRAGATQRPRLLGPETGWGSLRMLAVDDAPEVLEYFTEFAKSHGTVCDVASGAKEALELLDACQTPHGPPPFDIIFIDWLMPGMDGIELTRIIRERCGSKVLIVMITATQLSEIEEAARAAGVDHFMTKPLFSSMIVDCINDRMSPDQTGQNKDFAAEGDVDCFAGDTILLAEDIDINREIVISLLAHTGVVVECAENGQEACDMFAANPGRYRMVFMDIHMPEVDGFEATRTIRAMDIPEARTIPIIAMTANVFREDIEKCLAVGMDGHVGKPIDVDEMISAMKKHLLPHHAGCLQ